MSTPQKVIPMTRREMSSGLAFAEEHDLQRLSTWAAEGWRLAKIEHMWMVLEQAPPEQAIFAIDYQEAPDLEYFEMCSAAGWHHVTSVEQQIHLFKAAPGTAAIFSPADSTTKYQRAARMFAKPALWSSAGLIVSLLLLFGVIQPWLLTQSDSVLGFIIYAITAMVIIVLATISIFTVWPWVAYRLRLAGVPVSTNRLVFGLVIGLCGAVLGYFIGAMIP
ncbi:MAG: hypothetical protein RI985_1773 [Chloroflexota bacterium]